MEREKYIKGCLYIRGQVSGIREKRRRHDKEISDRNTDFLSYYSWGSMSMET